LCAEHAAQARPMPPRRARAVRTSERAHSRSPRSARRS
jgi:hypothetical protein